MKCSPVNNIRSTISCYYVYSVVGLVQRVQSPLFASVPCTWCHVQGGYWAFFSLWILCLPLSLPSPIYFSPLISHCNRCLVLLMCRLMAGKNSVSKGASTWKGLTKSLGLNQEIPIE